MTNSDRAPEPLTDEELAFWRKCDAPNGPMTRAIATIDAERARAEDMADQRHRAARDALVAESKLRAAEAVIEAARRLREGTTKPVRGYAPAFDALLDAVAALDAWEEKKT